MGRISFKTDTNNKAKLHRQDTIERERQLLAAVEFCRQNNCRRLKAIKEGICPMIKDRRTINYRLDIRDTPLQQTRSDSSILTPEEEEETFNFNISFSFTVDNASCWSIN